GLDDVLEFLRRIGEVPAAASESARSANDDGKAQSLLNAHGIAHAACIAAARQVEADAAHCLFEQIAVFGFFYRFDLGADHFDAIALEYALFGEIDGEVERRLSAEGRQNRVGPFLGDYFFDDVGRDRFDVGARGELRIGHDRRGIGVDENDPITLFFEGLQRLGAGVVELASLPDDDRARADEKDGLDVGALGHG